MKELNAESLGEILQIMDMDCVIVDKVFASCQQRECFPRVEVDLQGKTFQDLKFKPGFIVPNTLTINDIENRPNFRRVRFTLRIPFKVITTDGEKIEGFLPDIFKDVVLYIPDARDEFEFNIVVETSSTVLGQPIVSDNTLIFAAGVFIVIKVVGKVQLLIPTYGYCPPPEFCEEFSPDDICDNFEYLPFPPNFYPPQLEN